MKDQEVEIEMITTITQIALQDWYFNYSICIFILKYEIHWNWKGNDFLKGLESK